MKGPEVITHFSLGITQSDDHQWVIKIETNQHQGILSTHTPKILFAHSSKEFIEHVLQELQSFEEAILLRYWTEVDSKKNDFFCLSVKEPDNGLLNLAMEPICSYNLYSNYLALNHLDKKQNNDEPITKKRSKIIWEILGTDNAIMLSSEAIEDFHSGNINLNVVHDFFIDKEVYKLETEIREMREPMYQLFKKHDLDDHEMYIKAIAESKSKFDVLNEKTWEDSIFPPRLSFFPEAQKLSDSYYSRLSNMPILKEFERLDLNQFLCIYMIALNIGSALIPFYCLTKNKKSTFFAYFASNVMWNTDVNENLLTDLEKLYSKVTSYLELVEDPDAKYLKQLASAGETGNREYKAQARYDRPFTEPDRRHYFDIVKSICGMINGEGGTILVGYHEKTNQFVGLKVTDQEDRGTKGPNTDKMSDNEFTDWWELYIRQHLENHTKGHIAGEKVKFDFKKINERIYAVIEVETISDIKERVWCENIKGKYSEDKNEYIKPMVLYQRQGPRTVKLKQRFQDNPE